MSQQTQPHDRNESFELLFEEKTQGSPLNCIESHEKSEIVEFYTLLLDNYNTKNVDSERLEKENKIIRAANYQLIEEKGTLERRHADQEYLLAYYGQLFDRLRQEIAGVMRSWEGSST